MRGGDITENKSQMLIQKYALCKSSCKVIDVGEEKFSVTAHFVGERRLKEIALKLAFDRADREAGIK